MATTDGETAVVTSSQSGFCDVELVTADPVPSPLVEEPEPPTSAREAEADVDPSKAPVSAAVPKLASRAPPTAAAVTGSQIPRRCAASPVPDGVPAGAPDPFCGAAHGSWGSVAPCWFCCCAA
ncbi:hypothetical protein GCM10025865_05870 [Paraoerskovia sediminicola]|uniref:Uncharacterized protein n=1 Tax=Paraoerskovia sediminicola TaxID=1138587 RepID=A0ABN6XCW9_9CELL|nr:hypothetical protein GCM10025865_05870 [Paraoerskovia sediminicola]